MNIIDTPIADVKLIRPTVFSDERGHVFEAFQQDRYQQLLGIQHSFVQDNSVYSSQGVLRGSHFQTEQPQGKLIRVSHGSIFDVAVDIRLNSPTYGQWYSTILSADNHLQLWIPPGLAHGFLTLSKHAVCEYKLTDYYNPAAEYCLAWNDPTLNIKWPTNEPLLSTKDRLAKTLNNLYQNTAQ